MTQAPISSQDKRRSSWVRMRKLRIPWLASSKATLMPLRAWLVEQERGIRDVVRRREKVYLRMMLRDVVQAWFNFVFVGSDSDDMTDESGFDVADFFDSDDAP